MDPVLVWIRRKMSSPLGFELRTFSLQRVAIPAMLSRPCQSLGRRRNCPLSGWTPEAV